MKIILGMLNEIHERKFDKKMDFVAGHLESYEKTSKFQLTLEQMGLDSLKFIEFLKEESYHELITQ